MFAKQRTFCSKCGTATTPTHLRMEKCIDLYIKSWSRIYPSCLDFLGSGSSFLPSSSRPLFFPCPSTPFDAVVSFAAPGRDVEFAVSDAALSFDLAFSLPFFLITTPFSNDFWSFFASNDFVGGGFDTGGGLAGAEVGVGRVVEDEDAVGDVCSARLAIPLSKQKCISDLVVHRERSNERFE